MLLDRKQVKAKTKVDNQVKHTKRMRAANKEPKNPVEPKTLTEKEELVSEEVKSAVSKGFDEDFYPREWLCFVLFGNPAREDKLEAFASGTGKSTPSSSAKKRPLSLEEVKGVGAHMRTKRARKIAEKSDGKIQSESVRLVVEREKKSQTTLLNERIAVLKEMLELDINPEDTKAQLRQCFMQLNQHLASLTETVATPMIGSSSSASSSPVSTSTLSPTSSLIL